MVFQPFFFQVELYIGIYLNYRNNYLAMQKLHREVEKAKRTLSSFHEARIEIDDLLNKGETFIEKLTRTKFEELNKVSSSYNVV